MAKNAEKLVKQALDAMRDYRELPEVPSRYPGYGNMYRVQIEVLVQTKVGGAQVSRAVHRTLKRIERMIKAELGGQADVRGARESVT